MKKILIIFVTLIFASCDSTKEGFEVETVSESKEKNILLITGEGGTSGNMFIKAAETYKKLHGGEIYDVKSGDGFVAAIKDFVDNNGKIDHLEYFGHGNHVGLYVNQQPGVNGGVYANDPDLNAQYLAASIYELEQDIFAKYGWIRFNGCNVAAGHPEANSLAQSFANYFDVDVVAPRGPTEFSMNPDTVEPIPNSNFLDPNFADDVYMVSTYSDKDFITVEPQSAEESPFSDVRKGQDYYNAVNELYKKGLKLGENERFLPYKNITAEEALEFCRVVFKGDSACILSEKPDETIRNLSALKMMVEAQGVKLKRTDPWHSSYMYWAGENNLLTRDFTTKKWYTRGEMAELSWRFSSL